MCKIRNYGIARIISLLNDPCSNMLTFIANINSNQNHSRWAMDFIELGFPLIIFPVCFQFI